MNKYRRIIEEILEGYAALPYPHDGVKNKLIVDREASNYLLMAIGRDGYHRVHHCFIHLELIGDKIWIHFDGTEIGIAKELVQKGIPKDHIVLAFQSPERRQHGGYAVA